MRGSGKWLHEKAMEHGFLCCHPESFDWQAILNDILLCDKWPDISYVALPCRAKSRHYDEHLYKWRLALNYDGAYDQHEQLILDRMDYCIAYVMWGEPRVHGCLDSGL